MPVRARRRVGGGLLRDKLHADRRDRRRIRPRRARHAVRHARVHPDVVRAAARLKSFVDDVIRDIATRRDRDGTARERISPGMFEARQPRSDYGKRCSVHAAVRRYRERDRRRILLDPAAGSVLVSVLEQDGALVGLFLRIYYPSISRVLESRINAYSCKGIRKMADTCNPFNPV